MSQLESENHRLRLLSSAALRELEVATADDWGCAVNEAEALLKQVVTLDGKYVPRDEVRPVVTSCPSRADAEATYAAAEAFVQRDG